MRCPREAGAGTRGRVHHGARQLSWTPRSAELSSRAFAALDCDLLLSSRGGWTSVTAEADHQFPGASGERGQERLGGAATPLRQRLGSAKTSTARAQTSWIMRATGQV